MTSFDRFRNALVSQGAAVSRMLTIRYWGFFVVALVFASGFAAKIYSELDLPQRYSELVVGYVAWAYENKFHDYAVLYAFVIAFLVALVAVAIIAALIEARVGTEEVDRLHNLILILCAPAALWVSGLLTTHNTSRQLLEISQSLLLACLGVASLLMLRGKNFWRDHRGHFGDVLQMAVMLIVVATLSVSAVAIAQNRLGGFFNLHAGMRSEDVWRWTEIVFICAGVLCAGLIVHAPNTHGLRANLSHGALGMQFFMPLFLLCLAPPAWIGSQDAPLFNGYRLSTLGTLVVFGGMVLAYIELGRKFRHEAEISAIRILTIGSALGLLLFFKTPPQSLPSLMSDDYHFGELLVPWWSWHEMGMLPFWDYAPARGLINYFPGFISENFFNGNAANIGATYPFVFAGLGWLAIVALRPLMGVAGAFVALLLGPYANGIGEIDIAVTVFLVVFCWGWLHWRSDRWLLGFAAASVAILLYAPGQGALAAIALSPLVLSKLWMLCAADRRRAVYVVSGALGFLAVVFGTTPLGKMFFAAVRYGAEQSQLNSIAHGVNWSASFGADPLNPWLFEVARSSFLLVALWAGVLLLKAVFSADTSTRRQIAVYALPVFIIMLLFVIRAAGRIDPGGSRLGIASTWGLAMLLPVLMFASLQMRGVHLLIWIGLAGTLLPQIGSASMAGYVGNLQGNFDPPDASRFEKSKNTQTVDISRLGSSVADPLHLKRIAEVKHVLDQVLDTKETYLDLSGRHALYYYVDRKPAIESASMYNLVGEKQQLRAIDSIRKADFPAILLSADNIVHDGGPSSLRSNLVYREVLLSMGYKLVTVGKQVWMVRDDRVARLKAGDATSIVDMDTVQALDVLDPIFRQQDLRSVPASWGRSAESLEKDLSAPVLRIASDTPTIVNSVRAQGDGNYAIEGADPYMRFDIAAGGVSGRRAGVLSFDFSCGSPGTAPMVGVYWATPKLSEGGKTFLVFKAHQGRLIVPVDSAPSWLLAERIDSLRFDIEGDSTGCEKFSLRNIELRARTATLPN